MSRNVAYFYRGIVSFSILLLEGIGDYIYKPGHPMKPQRIKLTHHLLLSYELYYKMEVYQPHCATYDELTKFHAPEYVDFLSKVTTSNYHSYQDQVHKFMAYTDDNPIFNGMYDFCQQYTGASIDAAVRINHKLNDICINWSGGLHHAKKLEAWGFCYVNDIVLCIIELLKHNPRVMYIDIDIHHGDGVEEAFFCTNRVMTVSFHKYGDYFPGTGNIDSIGFGKGKNYAVNIPLDSGIDDETYQLIFQPVIEASINKFRPTVIVLQCGADSITGDLLGVFNMSLKGHGQCIEYVRKFGIPMIILGGGGYTMRNVARCWAYETGLILNQILDNSIPSNDFMDWFKPDYQLYLTPDPELENLNTRSDIEKLRVRSLSHIQELEQAPSVPLQNVPKDFFSVGSFGDGRRDELYPDQRNIARNGMNDRVLHKSEYYDPKEGTE